MKNILFLCTGNSCRSQMAEGFARHFKRDEINAWSAGVKAGHIDPRVVRVMAESGIDISGHVSKNVDDLMEIHFDYVITLCGHAYESCPVFPGKTKKVHEGFDDPPALARNESLEEEKLAHYRRVRDEIRIFVESLPEALAL